jgi:hypothetical protein
MLTGKVHDLRHLGFGDLVRIDAANTDAFMVHVKHDAGRVLLALVEEALKDEHDKLHRREVVIQQ